MDMKRVGSFKVTDTIVYPGGAALDAVHLLLKEVFICSAVHNFGYGRFEYIGFSELFELVEEGCMAHEYEIVVQEYGDEGEEYYVAHFNKESV